MTMQYPTLSPRPLIDWGPGAARFDEHSTWLPVDAALQLESLGTEPNPGGTLATLAIHTADIHPDTPGAMIELTRADCLILAARLLEITRSKP